MIQYVIEKKASPKDRTQFKYYAKIVRGSTLSTKKVAALLQERTTLDIGEVYGFLVALSKGIRYSVTDSYTVEIAGLGIFTPTINATAVDSEEELKPNTITKKGVNYRPTTDMKNEYAEIKFTKANLDSTSVINGSASSSGSNTGNGENPGDNPDPDYGGGSTPGSGTGGGDLEG